ncbi:MAG TPA: ABC transporter substrate-binding protein [Nitrososphaerales archaeon]|nr:ABC transporter substrate-binding protein [Nitrososphaerales archaeon]
MRRKGASNALAGALLVVGLLVGAGLTYALTSTSTSSTSSTTTSSGALSGTITIGDLTDLSGQLSAIGTQQKQAVDLAVGDINNYLTTLGITSYKFAANDQDTSLQPAKALTDLQTLASSGVQVVVGPLTSAEASNVLQTANQDHIVLISASSTAISLAIPNDYLFRLVPNDAAQSLAIARELVTQNVKDIIVINQNSVYGAGLANATINRYKALGGNVQDQIQYSTTVTDFTPTLTTAQSDYTAAVGKYGAGSVAVVCIGFQEVGQMLLQTKSSFPGLLQTTWYGSDGESQNTDFTNSTGGVGPVSAQIKLISTIGENPAATDKYNNFVKEFTAVAKQAPDSYAVGAYDATWVAALSIMAAGKNSGQAIQASLPAVANNYFGAVGWTELQPSGDMAPTGYSIYEVTSSGGTDQWVLAGTWDAGTDAVTWQPGMP